MSRILLIGGFAETVELCADCGVEIAGVVDGVLGETFMGYPVVGTDEDARELALLYCDCHCVITPDCPDVRAELYGLYAAAGFRFRMLVAPYAVVSRSAILGDGCQVQGLCYASSAQLRRECYARRLGRGLLRCRPGGLCSSAACAWASMHTLARMQRCYLA